MKQRRAVVGRTHQPETCLHAPEAVRPVAVHGAVTLHPWLGTLGNCTPTGLTTGMPAVERSALGSVSRSERTFGKRLDGTGIPAYGTCRPKESPT